MSTFATIVLIAIAVVVLLVVTGLLASRRRDEGHAADYRRHLLEADEALERAKAVDKGWDRETLDAAAREAIERARPGWPYDELHLVLVDDRDGMADDRAHLVAVGSGGDTRVILARHDGVWIAENVDPTA